MVKLLFHPNPKYKKPKSAIQLEGTYTSLTPSFVSLPL